MTRLLPDRVADVGRALRLFYGGNASRWTQGATAKDQLGMPVPALHPRAECWCLEGACLRLQLDEGIAALYQALGRVSGSSVATWNDAATRTFADVEALLAVMVAGGARA